MKKGGHLIRNKKKIAQIDNKNSTQNNDKNDIQSKLLEIFEKSNKFEVFVDLITLLHENFGWASVILRILIDQYSFLPEENLFEASPLLLDALQRFPGIVSFDQFYNSLLENGREYEMWHFIPAFSLSPTMLKHYKQCRLSAEQIECIVKNITGDIGISNILLDHYELSPLFYEKFGEKAAPFIIKVIDKLDREQLKATYEKAKGSGSLLENILADKLGLKYNIDDAEEPFYLLDKAVSKNDWEQAAKIAMKCKMDEEYVKYISQATGVTGIHAKLMKQNIDPVEEKKIIDDFVDSISSDEDKRQFADFSGDAMLIAERIDKDIEAVRKRRKEETDLIERMAKDDEKLSENEQKVKISDKCGICNRELGHCSAVVFPCGHYFHEECLRAFTNEFMNKSSLMVHVPDDLMEDCPLCGINSAGYVHVPVGNSPFSPEFWALKI